MNKNNQDESKSNIIDVSNESVQVTDLPNQKKKKKKKKLSFTFKMIVTMIIIIMSFVVADIASTAVWYRSISVGPCIIIEEESE
jgi:accessory gene regulator protein AgrB